MKYKSIKFLMGILVLSLLFAPFIKKIEGFSSINSPGVFPSSVEKPILNEFDFIGKNQTSDKNYNQIWWHYPIFSLGSFEQITNNLKHIYNPDQGTCMRADFCNAFYKNKKNIKTNITKPLPEVENGPGKRVGYFRSEV
jgi:hypothetical protein